MGVLRYYQWITRSLAFEFLTDDLSQPLALELRRSAPRIPSSLWHYKSADCHGSSSILSKLPCANKDQKMSARWRLMFFMKRGALSF